jgi:hypothetical protein
MRRLFPCDRESFLNLNGKAGSKLGPAVCSSGKNSAEHAWSLLAIGQGLRSPAGRAQRHHP